MILQCILILAAQLQNYNRIFGLQIWKNCKTTCKHVYRLFSKQEAINIRKVRQMINMIILRLRSIN